MYLWRDTMAEHNSWENQGRQQHGWFGHGTDKRDTTQNIRDLAQVIQTEAEGEGAEAKVAVGHVLLNRMQRNGKAKVHDVWNGFAHHKQPDRETLTIARSILDGESKDTTGGATHFYTPNLLPREKQRTGGADVQDGLEQVLGVQDKAGLPVKTYRPGYAAVNEPREVQGVPSAVFKFSRAPGDGHVR